MNDAGLHGAEASDAAHSDAELSDLALQIARFVIEDGRVEGEGEEWLASLGVEVVFAADEQGYEDATEIAVEAVRLYTENRDR